MQIYIPTSSGNGTALQCLDSAVWVGLPLVSKLTHDTHMAQKNYLPSHPSGNDWLRSISRIPDELIRDIQYIPEFHWTLNPV